MRIDCPHCGTRDLREFSYRGDAGPRRPDAGAGDALERFNAYVYVRDNPAGPHTEFWYHAGGCQAWLIIQRDTRTHAIASVRSCKAEL
jgi:heterotetrameric sarcosine oxidase delta subunit